VYHNDGMTYKTHLSTGLLFSSIVFLLIYNIQLSPVLILLLIISTVIGSSAPDLDTPTGELWKKIPAGGVISRIVSPVFLGGHRHLSHSLIGFVLFSSLFALLIKLIPYDLIIPACRQAWHNSQFIILAYGIGHLSHLFADMFTEMGVPLLFPLEYHFGIPPIKRVRIKTGKWFENLIIFPAVNIALILVIYSYLTR